MVPRPHPYFSAGGSAARRRWSRWKLAAGALLAALSGAVGGLVWANGAKLGSRSVATSPELVGLPGAFPCHVASITDGDTFRCSETDASGRAIRVRVSGIDARERDGSCAPGHPCASASPEQATAALAGLISGQALQCETANETYGRIAAFCRRSDGTDISCAMLESGTVARWERYWQGHRCESYRMYMQPWKQ